MTSANRYLTSWEGFGVPRPEHLAKYFGMLITLMRPNRIWCCSKTMPTHKVH